VFRITHHIFNRRKNRGNKYVCRVLCIIMLVLVAGLYSIPVLSSNAESDDSTSQSTSSTVAAENTENNSTETTAASTTTAPSTAAAASTKETAAADNAATEQKTAAAADTGSKKAAASSTKYVRQSLNALIYTDKSKSKLKKSRNEKITVSGKLPKGAYVEAYPIKARIKGVKAICAYNIDIRDANGKIYEPGAHANTVRVKIVNSALKKTYKKKIKIYHVVKNANHNTQYTHLNTVRENSRSGAVSFTADSFSGYALTAQSDKPATITTVDSTADGITMDLFDYYANYDTNGNYHKDADDMSSNKINTPLNKGINSNNGTLREFQFYASGSVAANAANRTINNYTGGNTAMQGIVKRNLQNGYPVLNTSQASSLAYLFDHSTVDGKTTYAGVNHLFTKNSSGYYTYDSKTNYAYYDQSTGNFKVYDGTYDNNSATGDIDKSIGFFPFNDYDSTDTSVRPGKKNHHFGLTMSATFTMPTNGQVDGNDMVFDFSGDDDVWVFIDDVLVLDIGGIHGRVAGHINFKTGEVTTGGVTALTQDVIGTSSTLTKVFSDAGKTYDGSAHSKHTIKFFYLERGGHYSNCWLNFNLPIYKTADIKIAKNVTGEAAADYKNTEFKFKTFIETDENSGEYEPYVGDLKLNDGTTISTEKDGVFTMKSGQTATIADVNAKAKYYVEEVGVDSNIFTTSLKSTDSGGIVTDGTIASTSGTTNSLTIQSDKAVTASRSQLTFENAARYIPADVKISKTDRDGNALAGVEFKLYKASVSDDTWTKDGEAVSTQTSGSDGKLTLAGLTKGTYLLEETKTITGYQLPEKPWRITVDTLGKITFTDSNGTAVSQDNGYYNLINYKIYELPSSGGDGLMIFLILGTVISVTALLLIIRMMRKEAVG
jgi:fibro-slime domain-containing protein